MRIAVVSDDKEKLLLSDFIRRLKDEHDVRIVAPLVKREYGLSVDDLLEKEKETVPFYRCDIVLYRAFHSWEHLTYTMKRVLGYAVVGDEGKRNKKGILQCAAAVVHESNVDVNEWPKHLHWYNRSIGEIESRYKKFGFHIDNLKPYFETFVGVPMSINEIIAYKGEQRCR